MAIYVVLILTSITTIQMKDKTYLLEILIIFPNKRHFTLAVGGYSQLEWDMGAVCVEPRVELLNL